MTNSENSSGEKSSVAAGGGTAGADKSGSSASDMPLSQINPLVVAGPPVEWSLFDPATWRSPAAGRIANELVELHRDIAYGWRVLGDVKGMDGRRQKADAEKTRIEGQLTQFGRLERVRSSLKEFFGVSTPYGNLNRELQTVEARRKNFDGWQRRSLEQMGGVVNRTRARADYLTPYAFAGERVHQRTERIQGIQSDLVSAAILSKPGLYWNLGLEKLGRASDAKKERVFALAAGYVPAPVDSLAYLVWSADRAAEHMRPGVTVDGILERHDAAWSKYDSVKKDHEFVVKNFRDARTVALYRQKHDAAADEVKASIPIADSVTGDVFKILGVPVGAMSGGLDDGQRVAILRAFAEQSVTVDVGSIPPVARAAYAARAVSRDAAVTAAAKAVRPAPQMLGSAITPEGAGG